MVRGVIFFEKAVKITFNIYEIIEKTVCIPSEDYLYWYEREITVQEFVKGGFSTCDEAVSYIKENLSKGKYTIITTYTK